MFVLSFWTDLYMDPCVRFIYMFKFIWMLVNLDERWWEKMSHNIYNVERNEYYLSTATEQLRGTNYWVIHSLLVRSILTPHDPNTQKPTSPKNPSPPLAVFFILLFLSPSPPSSSRHYHPQTLKNLNLRLMVYGLRKISEFVI